MSQLTITTTQNVTINFTAASVGERLLGQILDILVIIAYSFVVSNIIDIIGLEKYLNSLDYWSVRAAYIIVFFFRHESVNLHEEEEGVALQPVVERVSSL